MTNNWESAVGNGWHGVVTSIVALCEVTGVRIVDVKEKFGGLRIYVERAQASDDVYDAVLMAIAGAERRAFTRCEQCGRQNDGWDSRQNAFIDDVKTANVGKNGWIKTFCAACRAARALEREGD